MKSFFFSLIIFLSFQSTLSAQELAKYESEKTEKRSGSKLMYTTYFYTAAEAVVHGYAKDTEVRIVNLDAGKTVWKGEVNRGQTKLVATGKGVFGFYSNKKASILVGTPSVCNVVGYWFRDQEGAASSKHYFGRLPSSASQRDERVLVWAWKDTKVEVRDIDTQKRVFKGKIKKENTTKLVGPRSRLF